MYVDMKLFCHTKRVMKFFGPVWLLLLLGACSHPDIRDTSGQGYRFDELRGKTVVINYWAVWCAPCIKEIPELAALDNNHHDIEVFGVNYDMPEPETMAKQIEDLNITFPVLDQDPHARFGIEKPVVLPTTLIINPSGELEISLIGPQTEASLLKVIRDRG